MATHVLIPTTIAAAGNPPKRIEEYVGRINSATNGVGMAGMVSPEGWREPGQQPEFTEYSVVLAGLLRVEARDGEFGVGAGEAVIVEKGERMRYSTPFPGGAEYVAVCLPAFSPDNVHRDA